MLENNLFDMARLEHDAGREDFLRSFKPIKKAPALGRTNGMGSGLYGWLRDQRLRKPYIKMYFVSFLWIPIIPICGYLVEDIQGGYRFHKRIGIFDIVKIFRLKFIIFYLSALAEGAALLILVSVIAGLLWGLAHIWRNF